MALIKTEHYPVKQKYYYILDFRKFMRPKLIPVYFVNREAAKRVLKANIANRNTRRLFSIIKGITIKNEDIPYTIAYGNYFYRGGKYIYPDTLRTVQGKKSFRTLLRRRLRRMGLQSTNKVKYRYDERVKKVTYKENHQKVAKNKNSDAKVFQLDRKPKRYYYIILKKRPSTKSGKLFKIKCIQVNVKTGEFKKVTIHTNRNDIFLPELLENLKKIENASSAIKAYRGFNTGK